MLPEIYSHVARYLESCRLKFIVMLPDISIESCRPKFHNAKRNSKNANSLEELVRVKCETVKLRLFVSLSYDITEIVILK